MSTSQWNTRHCAEKLGLFSSNSDTDCPRCFRGRSQYIPEVSVYHTQLGSLSCPSRSLAIHYSSTTAQYPVSVTGGQDGWSALPLLLYGVRYKAQGHTSGRRPWPRPHFLDAAPSASVCVAWRPLRQQTDRQGLLYPLQTLRVLGPSKGSGRDNE
jgi:hypothetical protein